MKFRFTTSAILLATAVAGISAGGWLGWAGTFGLPMPFGMPVTSLGVCSPLWMPVAFIAFAIGRKSLTVKMVIGFAIAEAIAFGIKWYLVNYQPFLQ